ncbi:MAG TPA: hypothetical protein VFA75_16300 [Nevskia sp.]|jgi:glycosyltransferase involved in cell wall biosynthesis|nr:hypothetical protein [Nevskia sp.]
MTLSQLLAAPLFRYRYRREYAYFETLLNVLSVEPVNSPRPESVKSITFVVYNITRFSGGHTSILRLGSALADRGFEVAYATFTSQTSEEMVAAANSNLPGFRGVCLDSGALRTRCSDVWVATHWESAYHIRNLSGYKAYYIQDYEPYFYAFGEKLLLARKTYEFGYRMITLGQWAASEITRNLPQVPEPAHISFPYENKEYQPQPRNFEAYPHKQTLKIAVYAKHTERRAPFIIQNILGRVIRDFHERGLTIEVLYFGESRAYRFRHGRNLGKLSKAELLKLYQKCDFGMVASLTNISLVPFEMAATKLPIIECIDGSFPYFFDKQAAVLTNFDWRDLSAKLAEIISDPNRLRSMTDLAYQNLNGLSWETSAGQFAELLLSGETPATLS